MSPSRRYYNTEATPQNLRALWDRLHDLTDQLTAQQTTITAQAATITSQASQLSTLQKQTAQALITAGKTTSATSTSNSGGGGGGTPAHDSEFAVVVAAIADLVAEGHDLSGPCGSWTIVNRVVQNLRPTQPDVGLIAKGGTNCNGYSIDALMYLDGAVYDILIDADNAPPTGADPNWSYAGQRPASDWRDPV